MAFTPQPGPVVDEPLRPRALWYWIGGGLIAAAGVGAIVWFVVGFMAINDTVDGFERVPFPEGGTVTIEEPGDYVIYAEGFRTTLSVTAATLTGPDGDEINTDFYSGSLTYDFGGRSGTAQHTFTAAEAGDYEIESAGGVSSDIVSYAVGESIGGDLVAALVGGFAIGGLGVLLGAIILIVTGVRRSRAKRARRPMTPPPPSSWGQAPPTWGPQPQQPQPGWGQPPPPDPSQPGGTPPPPGAAPGPSPPPPGGSSPPPPPGWPP